jgi:hypothetical protein
MSPTRSLAILATCALAASCGRCRYREVPRQLKGPDGRAYYLVARGAYKAFYDRWGRLEKIEYDSNGDRRPDQIAHHAGGKTPARIDVDEDFDGRTDRWEVYDEAGKLLRVGRSEGGAVVDRWTVPGPGGLPAREEHDSDGDGRVDRVETFEGGRISRVEIDADRDGRFDRWQTWEAGRLVAEELDTDGDGRPDRRIRYDANGIVAAMERLGG